MEAVRTIWSDERLDDLNRKVDALERRMDSGFTEIRTEIRELRAETNGRFDAVHRMILTVLGTMIVGFVSVLGSIIATGL